MNDWDFLLQKQGDCAWLPLESPSAEILEGYYQVIARSAELPAGTPVTVQITHLYEVEGVAQRRWQQRSLCLGPEGEILLLPAAYLGAGLWTLACAAEAPPGLDLLTHPAAQVVQLQVLALDLESLAWEPEPILAVALPEPKPALPSPAASRSLPEPSPALDLPTFTYPTTAWCLKVVQGPTLPPKLFDMTGPTAESPRLPPLPRRQPSQVPPCPVPSPAMEAAFESLRLQERFWDNLQTLSRQIISGTSPDGGQAKDRQPLAEANEVALPTLMLRGQRTETLAEIPLPTVVVQETVNPGKPLTIYIRLPQLGQRLGVKLWVCDCQTRALIDGPRWLIDFVPNPRLGMQEALTQITLPLTVEAVSFTAIAVDLQTQRESHRTVVQRVVGAEPIENGTIETGIPEG